MQDEPVHLQELAAKVSMIITSFYLYFVKKNKTDAEEFLMPLLQRRFTLMPKGSQQDQHY